MNFFDVTIEDTNIVGEGVKLPLPQRYREHVSAGQSLKLGVRPEHMHEGGDAITATVEVLEPLGADVFALGHVHETPMTARLDPETKVQVGDAVRLGVDLDLIHLFDADTQETVLSS